MTKKNEITVEIGRIHAGFFLSEIGRASLRCWRNLTTREVSILYVRFFLE